MDRAPEALHLYPSALARDAALDELPPAAWTGRHLAFAEFTAELGRLLPLLPGRQDACAAPLTGAARYALLLGALQKSCGETERRPFSSDAALQAVGKLIAAWKGAGLGPQHVASAAGKLPRTCDAKETLRLLARVYETYERLLRPTDDGAVWTDREAVEQALLARLDRAAAFPPPLLPSGAPLHVHGFHRLVRFQRRILERAAALGHPVRIHTPTQLAPGSPAETTFGSLRGALLAPPVELPREHLRLEAPALYAEVYEIGRRIRRWITEAGVAPPAICLAFRDLGAYSQAVADVFQRFAIPYYERRGEPAIFQPLVRVALSAVDACEEGLQREGLFRFLCSGVVDVAGLAGRAGATVDPDELHELALAARIDRFFGTAADNPAQTWAARLERHAKQAREDCSQAAATLRAVVARLDAMRRRRTAKQHVEAWRKLFHDAGLSPAALPRHGEAGGSARKERQALAALERALDAVACGPLKDEPLALADFSRLFTLEIQEYSITAEGGERGGVRVLSLYDLRGLRFEKLILGGMAEGSLPATLPPDPLLGRGSEAAVRRALEAALENAEPLAHVEPLLSDESRAEERALFEIACAAAAGGTLVFTRPRLDAERRPVGPSHFWDELQAMRPAKAEPVASIHPAPPLGQCLTPEEAELRAAWVLGGEGERSEQRAAAACFGQCARLQRIARLAAIGRRRLRFFASPSATDSTPAVAAGAHDGVVSETAPEAEARLVELLLVRHAAGEGQPAAKPLLSPSSLETLAACPFYFLAERLFHFRARDEPEEELSPLDQGGIWHEVLRLFYEAEVRTAHAAGQVVARLEQERKQEYLERLKKIAAGILDAADQERFVGHPGVWALRREEIETSLELWLEHELAVCATTGFCPAAVELEFGSRQAHQAPAVMIPLEVAGEARCVSLEGRMDRLDLQLEEARGAAPLVTGVRVLDYKTGSRDRLKDGVKTEKLEALLTAQLSVYLSAALGYVERLRQQGRVRVDADRLWEGAQAGYYGLRDLPQALRLLRDGKPSPNLVLVQSDGWPAGEARTFLAEEHAGQAKSLFSLARAKVTAVLKGQFLVRPPDCKGVNCPARLVCRYQDFAVGEEGAGGGEGGGA